MGGKESFVDAYQIGKLQAMSRAKGALLDHREPIHRKAEQPNIPKDTYLRKESTIVQQLSRELNRAEEEKVLGAIKAKQASLGHGQKKQWDIEDKGLALRTQQIQQEVKLAAQEAPPDLALGPFRTLLVWLLKKLPDRVYKLSSAAVILSMALSACSAINRADVEPGHTDPVATEESFLPDNAGQEIPIVEAAEIMPALSPVEALLAQYEAGESLDVSSLTQEEFVEFSARLAKKKNEARGINPIIYNNEAYISPDNYMMMNYDGHPDMNETIQMFVPIAGKDENGNLQFENKGEIVTIPGSAEMDWNMVVSSTQDTRIDWPQTTRLKSGLTDAEQKIDMFDVVLTPMIMLDKDLGQFYLSGKNALMQSTLNFFQIETDEAGNPILARKIITHGVTYNLYEEGSGLEEYSNFGVLGSIQERSPSFYKALSENSVYYVGGTPQPAEAYEKMEMSTQNYSGIVADNDIPAVILGEKKNNRDMLVAPILLLIKKAAN